VARAEKSIVVRVPARATFRWWTAYETFPAFLDGVTRVTHDGNGTLHWEVEIAGHREEWDAQVSAEPEHRVAWQTAGRPHAQGAVELRPLEGGQTLVTLCIDYEPEKVHDVEAAHGMVDRMVINSLERFKEFAEPREDRRVPSDDRPPPRGAELVPGPEGERGAPLDPNGGEIPVSERHGRFYPAMLVREDGARLLDEIDYADPAPPPGRDDLGAEINPRAAGNPRIELDANEDDNIAEWSRERA
jgi:hypothetical protein